MNEDFKEKWKKSSSEATAFAHVLIEAGVIPGDHCRCEDCRFTARSMAEAGYLEDIQDKNRWWEVDPEEKERRDDEQ